MLILDVCCGSEKIYQGYQKNLGDSFIAIDIRKGDFSYKRKNDWATHKIIVEPTVLADMRYLPFKDESIDAIVFDPPHLKCGENSYSYAYYGSWSQSDTTKMTNLVNVEFSRVLKPDTFLFLKTMGDRREIYEALFKSFVFFLPMQLKRPRGTFKNPKPDADGAIWLIGCKKEKKQTDFSLDLFSLRLTWYNCEG
jgi:SAM-dependent methyltransferase